MLRQERLDVVSEAPLFRVVQVHDDAFVYDDDRLVQLQPVDHLTHALHVGSTAGIECPEIVVACRDRASDGLDQSRLAPDELWKIRLDICFPGRAFHEATSAISRRDLQNRRTGKALECLRYCIMPELKK